MVFQGPRATRLELLLALVAASILWLFGPPWPILSVVLSGIAVLWTPGELLHSALWPDPQSVSRGIERIGVVVGLSLVVVPLLAAFLFATVGITLSAMRWSLVVTDCILLGIVLARYRARPAAPAAKTAAGLIVPSHALAAIAIAAVVLTGAVVYATLEPLPPPSLEAYVTSPGGGLPPHNATVEPGQRLLYSFHVVPHGNGGAAQLRVSFDDTEVVEMPLSIDPTEALVVPIELAAPTTPGPHVLRFDLDHPSDDRHLYLLLDVVS